MNEWITHRLPTEADLSVDGDVLIPCKVTGFNGEVLPGESVAYVNGAKIPVGQRWWPGNTEARKAAVAEQESAAAAATNPEPTPEPTPEPAAEPSPAVAGVPSDQELWRIRTEAAENVDPSVQWLGWSPQNKPAIAAHRALYDYGYRRCLEEAKATWELNSGLARDLTALQEENAQLRSEVKDLLHRRSLPDKLVIGDLEAELERRDAESEHVPTPAPEPAIPDPSSCGGCRWYSDSNSKTGLCCRHAPTHKGFPRVAVEGWCGDFTESTHKGNH